MRNRAGVRYRTNANNETAQARELARSDPAKKQTIEAALRPWLRAVRERLRRETSAGALLDGRGPTASECWEPDKLLAPFAPHANLCLLQSPGTCGPKKSAGGCSRASAVKRSRPRRCALCG